MPELSLLHEAGLCGVEWAHRRAVHRPRLPVDPSSLPVPLSDSVSPLYVDYVNRGFMPGGEKVCRNTLLLPMLDIFGVVGAMLTCRLNRPIRGRHVYYPWTKLDGHAGSQIALDVYLSGSVPRLFGAGTDGRVADLTPIFEPDPRTALTLTRRSFPSMSRRETSRPAKDSRTTSSGSGSATRSSASPR